MPEMRNKNENTQDLSIRYPDNPLYKMSELRFQNKNSGGINIAVSICRINCTRYSMLTMKNR